jgi:hypothetical protein
MDGPKANMRQARTAEIGEDERPCRLDTGETTPIEDSSIDPVDACFVTKRFDKSPIDILCHVEDAKGSRIPFLWRVEAILPSAAEEQGGILTGMDAPRRSAE